MKYLIYIAHGSSTGKSHAHTIAQITKEVLVSNGNEVRIIDLIKSGFNQCLDESEFLNKGIVDGNFDIIASQEIGEHNLSPAVQEQHRNMEWCDFIFFIGPIWWNHLPSCYYAFLERTFVNGFTTTLVDYQPNFFKEAMMIATFGMEEEGQIPLDSLLYSCTSHLIDSGLKVHQSQGFYGCSEDTPNWHAQLEAWKKVITRLSERPILTHENVFHLQTIKLI